MTFPYIVVKHALFSTQLIKTSYKFSCYLSIQIVDLCVYTGLTNISCNDTIYLDTNNTKSNLRGYRMAIDTTLDKILYEEILLHKSLPNSKNDSTLSDRLKLAIEKAGISQAELARQIGVKQQAIQYLCSSKTKKSRFTFQIAEALNISATWLASGVGQMILENDIDYQLIKSQTKVPILTFEQIKNIATNETKFDLDKYINWILVNRQIGDRAFAIQLKDQSMFPRFEESTVIIVDKNTAPKNNDYVLAHIKNTNEIVFRQYVVHKKNKITLSPINSIGYSPVEISAKDEIIGVMKEARWFS